MTSLCGFIDKNRHSYSYTTNLKFTISVSKFKYTDDLYLIEIFWQSSNHSIIHLFHLTIKYKTSAILLLHFGIDSSKLTSFEMKLVLLRTLQSARITVIKL